MGAFIKHFSIWVLSRVDRMWLLLPDPPFNLLVGLRPSPSFPRPALQENQGDVGVVLGGLVRWG